MLDLAAWETAVGEHVKSSIASLSRMCGRLLAACVALLSMSGAFSAHAQSITIGGGNNQTGTVATTLSGSLTVKVKSRFGFAVSGVTVTFTPCTGCTVTPASAVTNLGGNASTKLTFGTVAGTKQVTASATGYGTVTFTETAVAAAPAKIALSPASAATQAGTAVTYSATIQDTYGNTVTSATNAVTMSVSGVTGTFSPGATVTPSGGVATASLTASTTGTATVKASATGLTGASAALSVSAGAPAKLVLSPSNSSTGAGAGIAYSATIQDAFGNVVSSATNPVTFTIGGLPGTFSPASPVTPTGGVAKSVLTSTVAGSATVTVSATGLASASTGLTVVAAAPAKIALAPLSASTQTGVPIAYAATVQDSFGNTVGSATNPVTFSVSGISGTFSPNSIESPIAPVNGVAKCSFTASTAGTGSITANSTGLTGASATLSVTLAQPAKLSLTPATATASVGTPVTYTVAILDSNGNLVPSATNAITLSVSGVSGSFSPASPLTPVNGVASATFVASTAGAASINASATGLTGAAGSLNVTLPSGATQSLFTTQTPVLPNASDNVPYELGMKFRVARSGQITGIRYWKASSDTGTHIGRIWSAAGTQLAAVTFAGESASGWQQQLLSTPLPIPANTTYVVSVNIAAYYPFTNGGLATSIVNGDISSVADGNNGVFGPAFGFPTNSFQSSNYFRDILFVADSVPTIVKVSGDNQSGAAGSTLPNALVVQVRDGSNNPVANATVNFAIASGGGSVSPASALTDSNGVAGTSLTLAPKGLSVVSATAPGVGAVSFNGFVPNAISIENQQAGSGGWQLTNPVSATAPEIAGYAAATSVNKGGSLPFMISLAAAGQYQIDVWRLGYYRGTGGRLVGTFGPLNGATQAPCNVTDTTTLLIQCAWTPSFTLQTATTWTTGLYVANLTALASGKQSQIWFVLRDDGSAADLLFQSSFNTFVAYSNYGTTERHSLYEYNSTNGVRAYKVSFDRPFGQVTFDQGNNNKLTNYERNMASWLESQGYDVAYITDVDTHTNPGQLLQHKAYLAVGHDEYWSLEMRNGVEQARDSGVNLGFFAGNSAYWRVRFEASGAGVANRVMACYKDPLANDPVAPTYLWRGPQNNRPENALLGVMYVGDNDTTSPYPYVVANSADPYYANTGFVDGSVASGIVGYEWDAIVNNGFSPAGAVSLSSSPTNPTTIAPYLPSGTSSAISNAARYTAASGAKVFATGSIQFAWGLDSSGVYPPQADPRIKQFVVNVLSDLGARPVTPNDGVVVP
jgi:hypothetical protein